MLVLLPPSETKRDGGDSEAALDLARLSFGSLTQQRTAALNALLSLSLDAPAAAVALGLSAGQMSEVGRNRRIAISPTMPAIDRFTGVLFDGLEASTLDYAARDWIGANVAIHSALFGLIGACDPIPAYRLSHDSKLPGIALRRHWANEITRVLADEAGFILDVRSESYARLGPLPAGGNRRFLRVVSEGVDGRKRALNHFNKKGKGEFVRRLAEAGGDHVNAESLIAWARSAGVRLEPGAPGELELTV
ncbi:MAG: YaaA family protein [Microbacteriaceae bacterium]